MRKLIIFKYLSTYMLIGIGIGSYFPILSSYLTNNLGTTNSQVGLLLSIITILPIFTLPLWGVLTDLIKSPKKTLLISLSFSIILIFSLIFIKTFILFLIVITIFCLFRSPLFSLYDRILINICKEHKISYGIFRAGCSIGFSIAPFIGMYLGSFFPQSIIFILSSICFLIVGIIVFFMEDVKDSPSQEKFMKKDFKELLGNKNFLIIILIISLLYGVNDTNLPFMSTYLESISETNRFNSLAVFLSVIVEVPMLSLSRYIYKRFSIRQILLFVNVIMVIRYVLYFLFPTPLTIILLAPFHGITFGLSYPLIIEYIAAKVNKTVLSTAYSIFAAVTNTIIALISLLSGILMDQFASNIHYLFIFFFAIHFCNIILVFILLRKKLELN